MHVTLNKFNMKKRNTKFQYDVLLFYGIRFTTKLHVYNVEIEEKFSN